MPLSSGTVTAEPAELVARAIRYLTSRGAPPDPARVQAVHLVEAELRGHPSHGLRRLTVLGLRMERGLLDPAALPVTERIAEAALRVDGRRGFGPVAGYAAVEELLDMVPRTGVAVAAIHGTHHLGMLAPYVERMSHAGVVSVVLSSTEGLVHPWGGAGALLGTNPIGIGVGAEGGDLTLDMSTGAVSAGKILDYRAKGLPIPDGWAVDARGLPTTDAAAAAAGAISPFGGPKGYALGLAFGAIVGALTGTALGPEVRGTLDAETETTKGDVFVAFDAEQIAGRDMRGPLGSYFERLRSSGETAAVPGDRAREERARRQVEGVELAEDLRRLLADVGAEAVAL